MNQIIYIYIHTYLFVGAKFGELKKIIFYSGYQKEGIFLMCSIHNWAVLKTGSAGD